LLILAVVMTLNQLFNCTFELKVTLYFVRPVFAANFLEGKKN